MDHLRFRNRSAVFSVKRCVDIVFSLAGLVLLAPLFLIMAYVVCKDGGPAFFRQDRIGKNGRIFRIYKFRSMVLDAENQGAQITAGGDRRITPVGHLLRKTKIDELPQLINVFLGHMSLVGPRPEVPYYVARWGDAARKEILSVKPGITDYATLFYNDEQSVLAEAKNPEEIYIEKIMPHKLKMYQAYIRNHGLRLDLTILVATLLKITGFAVDGLIPETALPVDKSNEKFPPNQPVGG